MSTGEGDNIQVFVRVRPVLCEESAHNQVVTVDNNKTTLYLDSKAKPKSFRFDYVADVATTQETVFNVVGRKIIESCVEGYNGTIFAYGQTGSGKTYTMLGPSEDSENFHNDLRGVVPRSFEYLFSLINRQKEIHGEEKEFLCKCSFLEIYNEHIFDLLEPSSTQLQLRESFKTGVYVNGISEHTVKSASEAYEVLTSGWTNRRVASTAMNRESSRSHAVFTVCIESKEKKNGVDHIKSSMLNLVDLAGSERQKDTGAVGDRLKEASSINKSLSNLGNVIMSLVAVSTTGKNRYIPYRDSKLTFLLKDSLGGNAKTRLVACCHPGSKCYGETLSTLQFASRAKLIKNKAILNEDAKGNITALQLEIRSLKEMLSKCVCGGNPSAVPVSRSPEPEDTAVAGTTKEMFLQAMALQQRAESQLVDLAESVQKWKKVCAQKDEFLQASKMVVKFRIADIKKLKGETSETRDEEIDRLNEELNVLRGQVEQHPAVAQLRLEAQSLRRALKNAKAENLKNLHADKARIEQLESKFHELTADEQSKTNEAGAECAKPSTPKPDIKVTVEKYKTLSESLKNENEELKQTLKEEREASERKEVELTSELQSSKKYIHELQTILSANNTKNKLEIDAINQQHLKTVRTMTTPKKESYKLRNRVVEVPGVPTPDLDDTIPFENPESLDEEKVPDEMLEQAQEALLEQVKDLQEKTNDLKARLNEKEAEIGKQAAVSSKLECRSEQMQELLSKTRKESEELKSQHDSMASKFQELELDYQLAKDEVQDLRIMMSSADRKVLEYKKKLEQEKVNYSKESEKVLGKIMEIEMKLEQTSKESESLTLENEQLQCLLETSQAEGQYQEGVISDLENEIAILKNKFSESELNLQMAEKHLLEEVDHSQMLTNEITAKGMEKEEAMLKKIAEVKHLQTELEALRNLLDGQKETALILRRELENKDQKINALEKRNLQAEEKINVQFEKVQASREKAEGMAQVLKSQAEEIASRQATEERLAQEITSYQQQLEEMKEKLLKETATEVAAFQHKLDELREASAAERLRHEAELNMVTEDLLSITSNFTDEQAHRKESDQRCEQLKAENDSLMQQFKALQEAWRKKESEEEEWSRDEVDVQRLATEVAELQDISRERQEENHCLRSKLQDVSREFEQTNSANERLRGENDELLLKQGTMEAEYDTVVEENKRLLAENVRLVGHGNLQQRIHLFERVKEENVRLKKELTETQCKLNHFMSHSKTGSAMKENQPPRAQDASRRPVLDFSSEN